MKIRIVILLIFLVISEGAYAVAPSTLFIYLQRTRLSEMHEDYRIRIGFIYDSADALSEGENSFASLSTPFVETAFSQPIVISNRDNRASFIFDLPLASIDVVNGDWNLLINSGATVDEDLSFTIVNIALSDFDNYEVFPIVNYNGAYNDVFLPSLGSGTGSSVQSGWISRTEIANGTVYRYPDGGPYTVATIRNRRDVGFFLLINGENQTLANIKMDYLDSISRIHFFVSQTPIPLGARINNGNNGVELTFNGLKVGNFYTLQKTENLKQYITVNEFISKSNALILNLDDLRTREFFRIIENP